MKDYKILLAIGNTVGDSVCFTPTIHALKKINPNFSLHIFTKSSQIAEMFSYSPEVDNIILKPAKVELRQFSETYDFAIAFPMSLDNFYELKRMGLKTFYPGYYVKPHAECALDLIKFMFAGHEHLKIEQYYLYPQEKHIKEAALLLQANNKINDDSILIGCHLGYSGLANNRKTWFQRVIKKKYGSRVWPPFNYAKLLERLLEYNPNVRFVILGTASEKKLIKKFFKKQMNVVVDLCDKTSLLTMAALMRQFDYFVSGDSGPLHFASAANIPMLGLYSETTAFISQPYPPANFKQVIVKPKISQIAVQEVFDKMVMLMDQFPPN